VNPSLKMKLAILIFSLLLGAAHSLLDPVVFAACLTACLARTPCFFGVCPECLTICAVPIACYDDNTTMETASGVKKVQEVEQGENVLTIMDGKEHWSEVTLNMNIPVTVPGFYVEALDSLGEEYKLTVTASHNVPSIDASEEILVPDAAVRGAGGKKSFEDLAKVVPASDLEIGQSIQVMSANNKDIVLAKITSIQSMSLDSKNVLFTADGTVLSNGVLTVASCDLPIKKRSLKEHMEKSIENTAFYHCVKESLSKENLSKTFSDASVLGHDNGDVYATDLFVFLLKHCGGIIDIYPEIMDILDEDSITPTGLDNAALLNMALKKKG